MKWRHFRNEKSKIQADHQLFIIAQQFLFTSPPSSTKPYLETRNYTLIQLAADKGYDSGGLALAQRKRGICAEHQRRTWKHGRQPGGRA